MSVLPPVFLFLLGLAAGSHVNVLVLRFGFGERGSPRSECAQCGIRIRWYDLLPVVSYFALRGRCRSCGSALSSQYPLVELGTAALFALAFLMRPPEIAPVAFVGFSALLVFLASAVAVIAYDFRHTLVPLSFAFALGISALVYRTAGATITGSVTFLLDAVLGAAFLGGLFALIVFISRGRGMGLGDAYVAAAIGLLLGVESGVIAVLIAVWSATLFFLLLMLGGRLGFLPGGKALSMKTEVPFAPWLLLGCFTAFFSGVSLFSLSGWVAGFFSH